MTVVNLFSEFIREKAKASSIPYESMHKKFWKDKKLQNEWKAYKSNTLKEIFVPKKLPTSFGYAPRVGRQIPVSTPAVPVSRKRPAPVSTAFDTSRVLLETPTPKKRGRPKGSKNKTKTPITVAQPEFPQLEAQSEMSEDWFEMEVPPVKKRLIFSPKIAENISERGKEMDETLSMGMEDYPAPIGGVGFKSLLSSIASIRNRIVEGTGLYKVQSVLFDKRKWDSAEKASKWLASHSYMNKGVDEKEDTYRYRQLNPAYVKKQGFKRFATKPLGNSGVSLILAYKK